MESECTVQETRSLGW